MNQFVCASRSAPCSDRECERDDDASPRPDGAQPGSNRDGWQPVANPLKVRSVELGPGERIDAIVEMNNPGVWILGEMDDRHRGAGMGIVVEYADRKGPPRWVLRRRSMGLYAVRRRRSGDNSR